LDFRYFPPPHNALTTCEILKLIVHEYDLQTRIRAITTDSASEMRPAMRLLCNHLNMEFDRAFTESFHIRCICHFSMVRELIKIVLATVIMREEFATIQMRLGRQYKQDVPNLDVESRWNSMFDTVNKCYELRDVFESLCNFDEFKNKLNDVRINDENWRELKSVIDVLEVMAKYTSAASGKTYTTLSM
jgi:hypothetical protein